MKMFKAVMVALLFLTTGFGVNAVPGEKLNVLFIVADDLNNDLGCYGHSLVKSPNIDKLAKRGIQFDRAYCQYPLCSPSRSSFLTGRRPEETRILSNAGPKKSGGYNTSPHFREFIPDTVTMSQLFRQNGYFVARVGKMYHYHVPGQIGTDGLDDAASWEQVINPFGIDKRIEDKIISMNPQANLDTRLGSTVSWLAADGADTEHTDGIGATEAIKLLKEKKDQPFFLAVGFFRPHTPYVAPKKYFEFYPLDRIEVPDTEFSKSAPAAAFLSSKPEQRTMTTQQRKEARQAYFASISFMDAQVGRVVDALDELGLAEKTIVVFTSDHGYHTGEHGLWQKKSLFEMSARVPLIVVPPKAGGKGKISPRTVELIDIYPTVADLCGLKAPDYLDGVSLKPLLENPVSSWDRAAYTQVMRDTFHGYSVRTEQWRYTEWDNGKEGVELYDHANDSGELKNLAADPAHAATVEKLRKLIDKNWPDRRNAPKPVGGKLPAKS
jgi:iduronate 2-sulfatase